MPYVMVPVPEEHVEDVMQYIVRAMARAAIDPWDQPSLSAMYDEHRRVQLARSSHSCARAADRGHELDAAEAARQIQMTPRETAGIMNELNIVRPRGKPSESAHRTQCDRAHSERQGQGEAGADDGARGRGPGARRRAAKS